MRPVSSCASAKKKAHHLVTVMRGRLGEQVTLVNGRGGLAVAEIKQIDRRKEVLLQVVSVQEEVQPPYSLRLFQAIAKPKRLDIVVEKCTELGVTEILLFPGLRSERSELGDGVLDRLKKISIAAMKQCGRLFLPNIAVKTGIADWKPFFTSAYFGAFSEPRTPLPIGAARSADVAVVIGPEAGFTDKEEKSLRQLGATAVCLHEHILRTDTASVVAVALLNFNY